jgi:hypothetical protein
LFERWLLDLHVFIIVAGIPGYTAEEMLERCEKVDRANALTVLKSKQYANAIVEPALPLK